MSIGGGGTGKITYLLTLDPGDSILVRFAVHGALSGDSSMTAAIFNELPTLALSGGIACVPGFCSAPNVQDFLLSHGGATGSAPVAVRLRVKMAVNAGFGEVLFSEANFFNSLDVGWVAPAGAAIVDPYGAITAVPEPAAFVYLGIGLGLVAGVGRLRRRRPCR